MKKLILFACVMLTPAHMRAQTVEERAMYLSVMRTPAGALAPMLSNTLLDRAQNGASLALRYGNLARGDFNENTNAFGVTGILPAGLGATLRVTGGVLLTDQNSLVANSPSGALMLGAGGDVRILGSAMGSTSASPLFTLSLDGEI